MGREIKYQAWEPAYNGMHNVIQMSMGDWIAVPLQVDEDEWELRQIAWADMELREYTGLKDKNGQEIYEGDLIIHAGRNGNAPHPVIMDKDKGMWAGHYRGLSYSIAQESAPEHYAGIEVIGNIYQNPELLN